MRPASCASLHRTAYTLIRPRQERWLMELARPTARTIATCPVAVHAGPSAAPTDLVSVERVILHYSHRRTRQRPHRPRVGRACDSALHELTLILNHPRRM